MMNGTVKDGGQAFPSVAAYGMTLRDYFAAQALTAMLSSGSSIKRNGEPITGESEFAAAAYVFADAMLAERSK